MPNLNLAAGAIAAAIEEWGPRLVAIPAGYAIGAWIGTLAALSLVLTARPEPTCEIRSALPVGPSG